MSKNITLKLTNNSQKPNRYGNYGIKARIIVNRKPYIRKLGVEVKAKHWDEKAGFIKNNAREYYPKQVEFFNTILGRMKDVRVPLVQGTISIATAFDLLQGKNEHSGSILTFVKNFKPDAITGSQSTIDKHYNHIHAINSNLLKLGLKQYCPIDFAHLQDDVAILNIGNAIHKKFGLAQNTIAGYVKSLNWVTQKAKLPRINPFTEAGFLVSEKPSDKNKPISAKDIMLGFNKINTLHQFEALCFWLYSFCLLGLDGKDIAGLSEKNIKTEGYNSGQIKDFFPVADAFEKNPYTQPLHIHIKRGKSTRSGTDSGVDAVFMINLFPTHIIHRTLKHLIDHNKNNYAYRGSDKLRLYNFDPKTVKGEEVWKNVRKAYSSMMGKKVGTTTQQTRHTMTNVAGSLGMSQEEVDRCLNHTIKGVNKHYWTNQQTINDVAHTHILQEYGILDVVKEMISFFKEKKQLVDNQEVPFIPDSIFTQKVQGYDRPVVHIQEMFNIGHLTHFSREDEVKYQTLLKEVKEGVIRNIDGVMTKVELTQGDYPKDLKSLILKRKNFYLEKPSDRQKLLDKIEFIDGFDEDIKNNLEVRKGRVVKLNTKTA